jgi:hypothetical protein
MGSGPHDGAYPWEQELLGFADVVGNSG